MDEPLGALDKKLREQMQFEIKRLHQQLGFTVIYVTHDQTEALTMSDRIAVFSNGEVQQCDAPHILYEHPANLFVADFIGESNKLEGVVQAVSQDSVRVRLTNGVQIDARRVADSTVGEPMTVSIRPEKLAFADHPGDAGTQTVNRISARFLTRHYVGEYIRYHFRSACGTELVVKSLSDSSAPRFSADQEVSLSWLPEHGHALDHREAKSGTQGFTQ